ncbi:hypothetical protein [Roseibacillus ishigakijimensis]|uniref:Uncharacterized protein n=1 Tax=Roseibacillus ishigakijimensis TaxID=454146 RepID=A0A934RU30_9BACT|nr:hypothetical protein [Roseibacillus ishigakijimensis]MBK1835044.1 hypothetical protein [Roseibacillus ishigakijimensis]
MKTNSFAFWKAIGIGCFLSAATLLAESEADHARAWADKHGGELEVRLADGTRADILTDTHAIEVEWASNWAESIGQSLWYARMKKRRAGVVLIFKKPTDLRYELRLRALIRQHQMPIDVWIVGKVE